ncbi:Pyruvate kinase [uncultured archaeon]|nr:Pyruvate kinase [uncultured archaeon]
MEDQLPEKDHAVRMQSLFYKKIMKNLDFLVTLWPTFPHFKRFAGDSRLYGIRLNSAMIKADQLNNELEVANSVPNHIPLYFDIKGRQLRITDVSPNRHHLEITLNHPIEVETPTMVLFKAGADHALLEEVVDGKHLIFDGGPEYMVYPGESIHIRHPSLEVHGPTFLPYEIEKISKAKNAGFNKFFLSYVESQKDIDQFREYVGDSEIIAKIENKKGLEYVSRQFRKKDGLSLMAARGDLYVELDRPHQIMDALKLIAKSDPEASVGSRILLSLVNEPVPSCSDFVDLAWLYDVGYKKMMLCDELCLKEDLLSKAVNALDAFRKSYASLNVPTSPNYNSDGFFSRFYSGIKKVVSPKRF